MTRREETITQMLERYREAEEGDSAGTPADNDSRAFQMPPTWTWAYKELERLLKLMRSKGSQEAVPYAPGKTCALRTAYWHVCAYYRDATLIARPEVRVVVGKHGRRGTILTGKWGKEVRRHRDAREEKALAGVRWLAAHWADRREPELPREFMAHAA